MLDPPTHPTTPTMIHLLLCGWGWVGAWLRGWVGGWVVKDKDQGKAKDKLNNQDEHKDTHKDHDKFLFARNDDKGKDTDKDTGKGKDGERQLLQLFIFDSFHHSQVQFCILTGNSKEENDNGPDKEPIHPTTIEQVCRAKKLKRGREEFNRSTNMLKRWTVLYTRRT